MGLKFLKTLRLTPEKPVCSFPSLIRLMRVLCPSATFVRWNRMPGDFQSAFSLSVSGNGSKTDRAAQAAALLATAAIQNGDRVGLALVSDRVEAELAPGGGPRHLARLLRALVATPAISRGTALTAGLARFRRSTRRALIV